MLHSTHTERPASAGARLLVAAAVFGVALVVAGCGGSSNPGVAHLSPGKGASSASSATGGGAAGPGSGSPEAEALAFAKCMRANGVPNFPDPGPGGGTFRVGSGTNPQSPAFRSARAKCQKLMPGGGIGSGPPPSAQTLARFLKISQCMRTHGVPDFPDPRTTAPSHIPPPAAAGRFVISDIEGVILVMGSIDTQSPTFTRAAAACAFPLHDH